MCAELGQGPVTLVVNEHNAAVLCVVQLDTRRTIVEVVEQLPHEMWEGAKDLEDEITLAGGWLLIVTHAVGCRLLLYHDPI